MYRLDLSHALAVFERVTESGALVEGLRRTIEVLGVLEMYGERDRTPVVAWMAYFGAQRHAQIDDHLKAFGVPFEWWTVRRESPRRPFEKMPAAATGAALARQLAELEGHAVENPAGWGG
jgi:hypothetical protein